MRKCETERQQAEAQRHREADDELRRKQVETGERKPFKAPPVNHLPTIRRKSGWRPTYWLQRSLSR